MTEFLNASSGWLSITALFLAIPTGIIANLITPRFTRWYALRSDETLRKRISDLKELIDHTDKLVSEPSYAVAQFAFGTIVAILSYTLPLIAIGIVATIIAFFVLSDPSSSRMTTTLRNPMAWFLAAVVGALCTYFCSRPAFDLLTEVNRVTRYKIWREETLKEIDTLKGKLSKQSQSTSDGSNTAIVNRSKDP